MTQLIPKWKKVMLTIFSPHKSKIPANCCVCVWQRELEGRDGDSYPPREIWIDWAFGSRSSCGYVSLLTVEGFGYRVVKGFGYWVRCCLVTLVVVLLLSCCCLVVVLLLSCCCLVVLLLCCCAVVVLVSGCTYSLSSLLFLPATQPADR